jgi:predicted peptidase
VSQQSYVFEREVVKTLRLGYWLYLPAGYDVRSDAKWPLVLFLHGAGERGDNLDQVKRNGPPKLVDEGRAFPFILVSPQCPADSWWTEELEALQALLDEIIAGHAVDETRLYLTGLSMGGYGTWAWAFRSPQRFAAAAPICGGAPIFFRSPAGAQRLRQTGHPILKLPIWAFHGQDDPVVPVSESELPIRNLQEAGGDVRLTLYAGVGHNSWERAYADPQLFDWLLGHTR